MTHPTRSTLQAPRPAKVFPIYWIGTVGKTATALLLTHWVDYSQLLHLYWKSPLCIENRDDTTTVSFFFLSFFLSFFIHLFIYFHDTACSKRIPNEALDINNINLNEAISQVRYFEWNNMEYDERWGQINFYKLGVKIIWSIFKEIAYIATCHFDSICCCNSISKQVPTWHSIRSWVVWNTRNFVLLKTHPTLTIWLFATSLPRLSSTWRVTVLIS